MLLWWNPKNLLLETRGSERGGAEAGVLSDWLSQGTPEAADTHVSIHTVSMQTQILIVLNKCNINPLIYDFKSVKCCASITYLMLLHFYKKGF